MSNDTVLSVDDLAQEIRRVDGKHSLGAGALAEALMPFIEQAVLQSEQVQAWRRDAERYQFAAQHCVLGGGVYKFGWPVAPVGKRQFDKYLDAAMEKQ